MKIGNRVTTLPTVKPPKYANKQGTVATFNEGEVGVVFGGGGIVWFREREIEECQGSTAQLSTHPRINGSRTAPAVGLEKPEPTARSRAETAASTATPTGGPLVIPQRADQPSTRPMQPDAPPTAPRPAEDLSVGDRGPSGGIVALCPACGQMWEREKRRGRPAKVCGECAK